jgi:hypothetical protein
MKLLDELTIELRSRQDNSQLTLYVNVDDNSLSRKWLGALNHLVSNNYHLEKNYCFFGFPDSDRNKEYLCEQINASIAAINASALTYKINDHFTVDNTVVPGTGKLIHDRLNQLHCYFEDLQGVSGRMSPYYQSADDVTRWHIRQLNLLCHEYESLILSQRKSWQAPEWIRPSQLMCWLNAPRFVLEESDYELFGIETINRSLGGVYVGVNKAVGKHHWEVFQDEGRHGKDIDQLTTSTLRSQTEAAGDFDIEWANDPGAFEWQKKHLTEFRQWLIDNNFDPEDKKLTIGHPQCGQVNLIKSFGTTDYNSIWAQLGNHLDVYRIKTSSAEAVYTYNWSDPDYMSQQIDRLR